VEIQSLIMSAPNTITLTIPLAAVLPAEDLHALAGVCRSRKLTFEEATAAALTEFARKHAAPPADVAAQPQPEVAR